MDSIQISGEDASTIALALIADAFGGQRQIQIEALQSQWAQLGLRLDDLVQGLTFLTRSKKITIDGTSSGSTLILSAAAFEDVAESGQGLNALSASLQEVIRIASERAHASGSAEPSDKERRDGFI